MPVMRKLLSGQDRDVMPFDVAGPKPNILVRKPPFLMQESQMRFVLLAWYMDVQKLAASSNTDIAITAAQQQGD